jgi:CheY-like chemotaxis protein/HD-like signal output (HDOD) protein
MANILHLDESAVAAAAMKGILVRANHRCVGAASIAEAMKSLRELVRVDLVFLELKIKGDNGLLFIQQVRGDCLLKDLPIVVYSQVSDHGTVAKALALKIQGYLVKPFDDEVVYREVKKALTSPWRDLLFEEEKSFCAMMGLDATSLRKLREELMTAVDVRKLDLARAAEHRNLNEAITAITDLEEKATAAGVWAVANYVQELRTKAEEEKWVAFEQAVPGIDFTRRLIYCHLNPSFVPEAFSSEEERREKEEALDRATWMEADAKNALPFTSAEAVRSQLDGLADCPTIDTVAAAFQMKADGTGASLSPLLDLVSKDPGLSVQVLVAAKRLARGDAAVVDDPRAAVSMMGQVKLQALAKNAPVVSERRLNFPPLSWPQFWMFQIGVGRLAKFTSELMELHDIAGHAYTAGLIHDFGKLLLLRFYPFALEAAVKCARDRQISVSEAERRFVGLSTWEMAEHFARKNGLPSVYLNVVRWVESPGAATEDSDLVAVVALARQLCIHHHVGFCGDVAKGSVLPIGETDAWKVLQTRVFPSFNLKKFDVEARGFCLNLKQELLGRERWYRTSDGN